MQELLQMRKNSRRKRDAVYTRLKTELAAAIEDGALAPGEMVPSESELSTQYGISRSSVRTALDELEGDGLIFKRPGKGTFVKDNTLMVLEQDNEPFRTIGIDFDIKSGEQNWYTSKLLDGVEEICNSSNCRISLLRNFDFSQLKPGFIDGYISASSTEQEFQRIVELRTLGINPVLINRMTHLDGIAYFSVNYRKESQNAVRKLITEGHRAIGIVSGPLFPRTSQLHYQGYCDALGIAENAESALQCFVPGYESETVYAEMIGEYLKRTRISAIYLVNGCFAMPLKIAADKLGIKLGRDLRVMCFDDVAYLAGQLDYSFSYVKMPLREMGRDAAAYLINKFKMGADMPVARKLYRAGLVDIQ